jgi:hypothetical protein
MKQRGAEDANYELKFKQSKALEFSFLILYISLNQRSEYHLIPFLLLAALSIKANQIQDTYFISNSLINIGFQNL